MALGLLTQKTIVSKTKGYSLRGPSTFGAVRRRHCYHRRYRVRHHGGFARTDATADRTPFCSVSQLPVCPGRCQSWSLSVPLIPRPGSTCISRVKPFSDCRSRISSLHRTRMHCSVCASACDRRLSYWILRKGVLAATKDKALHLDGNTALGVHLSIDREEIARHHVQRDKVLQETNTSTGAPDCCQSAVSPFSALSRCRPERSDASLRPT